MMSEGNFLENAIDPSQPTDAEQADLLTILELEAAIAEFGLEKVGAVVGNLDGLTEEVS